MAAAGAGVGYMAGGVPGAVMGGMTGHSMQRGRAPAAGGAARPQVAPAQAPKPVQAPAKAPMAQAPVQPPPMQQPPMGMQPPMQPKMGSDKSLIKKAKVILVKKAMNPLLAKTLTTGAAGAGLGAVGGAIGAGEGRRGQGAVRGALTGGLAGAGFEAGKAGLGAAMGHLAPQGHEKLLALLAKAKAAHPNITAAGQLAVPAALGVAGHQAGKQEQVQAY